MSSTGVVKVKRELLESFLTCSICKKLLKDATTISECLHTFCRKCIYEKLNDEELECCPACNIDLGCSAVEKLRPDHNLQDLRAKFFPLRTRKVTASEVGPSIYLPIRRKERSLSSLVVDTPRVSTQAGLTGRRTKAVARKAAALRGLGSANEESVKKEDYNNDHEESSSSPEHLTKTSHKRKNTLHVESPNHPSNKDGENKTETFEDKPELWQPLNCLVEVANRTKSTKYSAHVSITKTEQNNGIESEMEAYKSKGREHQNKYKVQDERHNSMCLVSPKTKKLHGGTSKRTVTARDLCSSAQALIDASSSKRERGTGPIWLSLVASSDQEGGAVLPQISARYLRIKDGNLPASYIQKYLARKLDLANESEVHITCRGQSVLQNLELRKLVDLWIPTGSSSQKEHATVGTSANGFVMIINYAGKVPAP